MKHGKNCNCPVCSLGKKMGMIKTDSKKSDNFSDNHGHHDHHDHHDQDSGHKCEHC